MDCKQLPVPHERKKKTVAEFYLLLPGNFVITVPVVKHLILFDYGTGV